MSTDFERQLRAEMGRVAVRPCPGLVRAAYHRYRSRRRAALTAAVTGTAAVAAVGSVIAAGATGTAGTSTLPSAHTAAYVVSHVSSALASTNTIEYSYTVLRVASSSAPGERVAYWDYGGYYGRQRLMVYTAAGQPYSDEADTRSPGQRPSAPDELTILDVEYTARSAAWEHFTLPPADRKPPGHPATATKVPLCAVQGIMAYSLEGISVGSVASCMRELLASGTATVAGHQRIGGVDTIKIVLTYRLPRLAEPQWRRTLWVNPSTYLPVQMTTLPDSSDGYPYVSDPPLAIGPFTEAVTEFQWLPPTPAHLAQLNAPIPPGFRVSGRAG